MPNHVTSVCTVTGAPDEVRRFAEQHIRLVGDEGKQTLEFDFNTIIPMPAILSETEESSTTKWAMQALGLAPVTLHQMPWGAEHGITEDPKTVAAWLDKTVPKWRERLEKTLQAVKETGHTSWYGWSIGNWGTKWNSYDLEVREDLPGRYRFSFATAWSFPEPIFRKLAELHPGLVFDLVSFDEGWNFACQGQFNGRNDFHDEKATDELYRLVYGREPPRGDDEDETP